MSQQASQLELELPKEYESSEGYKQAMIEYERTKVRRDLQPVFLAYNSSNKSFFVTRFFKKETVERYNCKVIKEESPN